MLKIKRGPIAGAQFPIGFQRHCDNLFDNLSANIITKYGLAKHSMGYSLDNFR